jgi:hypothetical protein
VWVTECSGAIRSTAPNLWAIETRFFAGRDGRGQVKQCFPGSGEQSPRRIEG